ncbi:MAG: alpha/beta hydrolase [Bacteroidota bacterium]
MIKKLTTAVFVGKCLNLLSAIWPSKAGMISFQLFCTPRKGRKLTEEDEAFLATASQKRISFRDFDIQSYVWEGGEKRILLAHGWESNTARWKFLLPYLQKENFTIIALDAPAHGKSGSKQVEGIMYAEAVSLVAKTYKPDYILGHSFGGMAAIYYAAELETIDIDKMIIMGTPSHLATIMGYFNEILALDEETQRATASAFTASLGYPIEYFSAEYFIQKVKLPGLLIHDVEDEVAPIKEARAIHENWEGARFFETKGLGHSLQGKRVYEKIVAELKNA